MKNPKKLFAFLIGHIEIGILTKFGEFGGHFDGLRANRVKNSKEWFDHE